MGNLQLPAIAGNQASNYATSNTADDNLDLALTGLLAKTITSADVTLTDAEHNKAMCIKVTGAKTGARNLIVKSRPRPFLIDNAGTGGFNLVVKTAAGSGVTITDGQKVQVYCDGTDVRGPF